MKQTRRKTKNERSKREARIKRGLMTDDERNEINKELLLDKLSIKFKGKPNTPTK